MIEQTNTQQTTKEETLKFMELTDLNITSILKTQRLKNSIVTPQPYPTIPYSNMDLSIRANISHEKKPSQAISQEGLKK